MLHFAGVGGGRTLAHAKKHQKPGQQLVPTVDGGVAPALEIMTVTPAIRNMIRDNKVHQIDGMIYSSMKEDMISMDGSLLNLYKAGTISRDTAIKYASNPDMLGKKL